MNASVDGLAVAFACVWTGAIASSQTPAPDWSGFPGPGVSSAGDVNADGFDDVIVGGYGFDNGQVDEGRACVYLGSASGVAPTPVWTAESNQAVRLRRRPGRRTGRAPTGFSGRFPRRPAT